MELLQAGVERSVIALWLGHESIETTQIYLDANLEMKQAALDKVEPQPGRVGRFDPTTSCSPFSMRSETMEYADCKPCTMLPIAPAVRTSPTSLGIFPDTG
jgi:hypothetical protein